MIKSPKKVFSGILFTVCLALLVQSAIAQLTIPKLNQRVNDFTNTLSIQEKQELEILLKSYEDTTSTQVVVLMINSLEGENLEEYANKTFNDKNNKIGQAKKNNGILLVIAKEDRQMRIEVGYGLEGVLTDALSSRIIRDEIRPYFRENNYFDGIKAGVDAIIRATKGEYQADNQNNKAPAVSLGLVIMAIFFGVFVLLPMLTSRRRSVFGSSGHNYFSGWGYGGGWGGSGGFGGGGGFGGFSGGGGMSGGGGASGSW